MRFTICLLLTMWCWRALGQEEAEPELMRLSRRPSLRSHLETPEYKASVVHTDPDSNRKHSISTVTVQLHLKDNKSPTSEAEDEDYVSAPSQDDYPIKPKILSESSQHEHRQQQQLLRQQQHHEHQQKMREQIEQLREQQLEEHREQQREQQKQETQRQRHHRKSSKNSNSQRENSITQDSETGASNEHASARYVLPPDGFIDNNGQRQQNVRYVGNQQQVVQYVSTPAPQVQYASSPAPPVNPNQNQQQQFGLYSSGAASNVQYFTTPAPAHFASTQGPRMQFVSSPTDYPQQPASQIHYMSTPAPNVQYESNFGSHLQASNNNVQYASTPAPRMQYMSTPSPAMQFVSQISQQQHQSSGGSQMQFASTPLPNLQHVSTQAPQGQYVSSPAHMFSTPSPQYSTNAPLYGSRLNTLNQVNFNNIPQKQMHIDHFDNAMSGVRNPKYSPQFSGSPYVSSTPSSVQVTTVSTPISHIQNEEQWRAGINPNAQNINIPNNQQIQNFPSNSNFHNQQLQNQHLYQSNQINQQQEQQLNQNTIEAANNMVVNIVHPNQNSRSLRQETTKITHQRDLEKETNNYSNGDFGWKIEPKKLGNQENVNLQSAGSYSSSALQSNLFGSQPLPLQSSSGFEFKPYPENPFLNHISFQTASPLQKTGSIQSISFNPDNNQQQNINVGYSIGFGGSLNTNQEILKTDSSVYANKYPFNSNVPGFTPSSLNPGNLQSDVIKGVHLSQVNMPDSSFFFKDSSNPQDYVTNALKDHEKMKQSNNIRYGSNNQISNFDGPPSPYKISQTFKTSDNENNFQGNSFSNMPKALSFHGNSPSVITTYHGSEVKTDAKNQGYKWNNVGQGVEISSPSHLSSDFRESVTPNPAVYLNNPNSVVTSNPFFYSSQRDAGDGRVMRGFDHANALKNIQPIGLSNVVSYSPAPQGDAGVPVTISPHYINSAALQQSYPANLNPIPSGHFSFPQEQVNMSPSSPNSPSIIEQSLVNFYNNYKPIDQSFYKDKNVVYNIQSFKPKQNPFENPEFSDVRSSFSYGKPRDQNSFESSLVNIQGLRSSEFVSPSSFIVSTPSDMVGHSSSNIESRHQAPQMEYVPSETFRQQNQETKTSYQQQQNEQATSVQINQMNPDGQTSSKYHHVITHPSTDSLQNHFQNSGSHIIDVNNYNNGKINQNMGSHNIESGQINGENSYQMLSSSNNQRQNFGDSFERQNEIDPNTGSKLTTIHGIKVANPYNVDLKVVSDMLRGKTAVDESRLEPLREQMTRLAPIQLDTSALQEAVFNNEQIDIPDHRLPEPIKKQEFTSFDSLSPMRLHGRDPNNNNQKDFKTFSGHESDFQKSSRPFQNSFEIKEDQMKYQHNIPNIASEQLQSSVQGVLSTHQIGAVIDQQPGLKARVRSHEEPSGPETQEYSRFSMFENSGPGFMENNFARDQHGSNTIHHQNAVVSEDLVQKRQKSESEEPYPLLKPPRPPMRVRANIIKKSEKRPFGTRQQRKMNGRHVRPIRVIPFHDQDEFEDYEVNYSIQTELRPPPVNMKKKSG